jgi:6-phosphogluconolactonase
MKKRVQVILMLIVALAVMGLASCGHYVCGANFGSSTCTPGTVGISQNGGSANAAFVFVADGSAAPGSIQGYTLNTSVTTPTLQATANFTPPATPPNDSGIGMAVAQKQFLYVAFGSTNQLYGWTISSVGILTSVQGSPFSLPLTFATGATSTFDTARVITNPAGTFLFIGDEFGSQIFVYQIGSGGVLTAVGAPVLVPFLPGNMTTDGLGKYLYITDTSAGNHTGSEIAAYSINSSTGALTAVPGSPFFATNFDMWQVEGEPTGKFLIGTKGLSKAVNNTLSDDLNLYVFTIGSSGALTGPAVSPTTYAPFNIATESNTGGNLVDSFGLDDLATSFNPVESFALSSSGTLGAVNGSPFLTAAVGTEGKFDQSGGLLFVYGGIFNPTDNTVIYTVTSFDVSAGNLTTPTPTGTFGGYWVATDAP